MATGAPSRARLLELMKVRYVEISFYALSTPAKLVQCFQAPPHRALPFQCSTTIA